MIRINLLSPWDKESLRWEKINKLLLDGIFWVVLAQIFFLTMFFFSLEYLKIEESSVTSQLGDLETMAETVEVKGIENDMAEYQNKIDNIYALQDEHFVWTLLFENISDNIPGEVRLESINTQEYLETDKRGKTISSDKIRVTLAGAARTRESLLEFEKKLSNMDMVSNLESDDSNYVKAINIDFSYSFLVNKDYLLNQ